MKCFVLYLKEEVRLGFKIYLADSGIKNYCEFAN